MLARLSFSVSSRFRGSLPLSGMVMSVRSLYGSSDRLRVTSLASSLFLLTLDGAVCFRCFSAGMAVTSFLTFPAVMSPSG